MKSSSIFLLVALFCLAHADPTPKEDNYRRELRELYNWTKNEFKPITRTMLNIISQAVRNATEDPRLFEGQDPAKIQPFVDKIKRILSNIEEAKNHADPEEKAMQVVKNGKHIKLTEGLTESAERHLDSIKQEHFRKFIKVFEDDLAKPSKECYDKFVVRFDETISKLTPSEREAHPDLTRWRNTKKSMFPDKAAYLYHLWEFLCWSYDELNVMEPSKIE